MTAPQRSAMSARMGRQILVTGSSGLVGSALVPALTSQDSGVIAVDIKATGDAYGDCRDEKRMQALIENADGIVHLAAISRVVWCEQDPERCASTNVGALKTILEIARKSPRRPWLIFASSREVYGQPESLPAAETSPIRPLNVYGRSKAEGERMVTEAQQEHHMRACIIRLSNVFGTTADHRDRVIPAFASAAVAGRDLQVEGTNHTFDFVHIDDVVRGIMALVDFLNSGAEVPAPIHFVSGVPTTLGELAALSIRLAGSSSTIRQAPPRDFDVDRFYGNPSRAEAVLGWKAQIPLSEGVARLVDAFRALRDEKGTL